MGNGTVRQAHVFCTQFTGSWILKVYFVNNKSEKGKMLITAEGVPYVFLNYTLGAFLYKVLFIL